VDLKTQGAKLRDLLNLKDPPVTVTFQQSPPPGVRRVDSSGPAGCSYWKLAAEGNVFYTEAADHYNCTIGAYTHGIALPEEKTKELQSVIGTMVSLEYIRAEEIPAIPHRTEPFGVAVYAPLSDVPSEPDVVLVRGNPKQVMLLSEAARAADIAHEGAMMGRPACAMIPETVSSGRANASLGCIGNRVYTGLADDELYLALPGSKIGDVVNKLETIVHANDELRKFHGDRAKCASG
jgi:uncharacterized protein (DUF169 family)